MFKKTYSGTILVLGIVMLIESIAIGIPASYFPNYATGLGASVASIGIFMSSFMLAYALMSPKMGALSDSYGRKKLMMVGLIGDVIFGVAQGLAPSWIWLLLIRIINGAVSSAAMISVQALLMDVADPEHRGEASGFVMSMQMLGHQVGPMFGGTIQGLCILIGLSIFLSYRVPYFVDSALAVVALALVKWKIEEPTRVSPSRLGMHETSSKSMHDTASQGMHDTASGGKAAPLSSALKSILVYGFVNGASMGLTMPLIVLFYGDKFGLQPVAIGTIISLSGFIGMFAAWLAGRLSDRVGRKPIIVVSSLVSYIGGFILPLAGGVAQAIGLGGVWLVGPNVGQPVLMALQGDVTPAKERGKYFGIFGTALTSGMIVGPITGTYLYGTYFSNTFSLGGLGFPGYAIPFFLNAILGLAATIVLQVGVREPKERAKRTSMSFH